MDTLAKRLKHIRTERKLNQEKLAQMAGMEQSLISKLERGVIQKTTSLVSLAAALRCNPKWLDSGDEPMEAGTATADITAPSFSLTATSTPSNQSVAPVVTAQADANSIASALAVIQKHTQRLSILDPPSRDLVQDLMQDCIKRPELSTYLDSVITRIFAACTAKQHIPDHRRTGTAD